MYVGRRECLPCSTRGEHYITQSIYNRCREGNVSREKGMSPAQEGTPIKEIHVSTPKKKISGFVSPLSRLRPHLRSRLRPRLYPRLRLVLSSPRLVLFCFAGAQPSKGELLSWCDTSQVTSLVSYAIADRRQPLNPLRIWRCPHSFWFPHLSSCTPSQVTYIDNVSSLVPCHRLFKALRLTDVRSWQRSLRGRYPPNSSDGPQELVSTLDIIYIYIHIYISTTSLTLLHNPRLACISTSQSNTNFTGRT